MRTSQGDIGDVPVALRLHDWRNSGNAARNVAHADIQRTVPLLGLQCGQQRQRHDASLVDECIDAAVRGSYPGDDALQIFETRDVRRQRLDVTAPGAVRPRQRAGPGGAPMWRE